jgi:hypothetical protein
MIALNASQQATLQRVLGRSKTAVVMARLTSREAVAARHTSLAAEQPELSPKHIKNHF